jgi:hypothetical protein
MECVPAEFLSKQEERMTIDPHGLYTPDAPELRALGAVQTLARWRHEGRGPAYAKCGSRVVYLGRDVLEWLSARRIETGEAG